jgi:hypothetical protein
LQNPSLKHLLNQLFEATTSKLTEEVAFLMKAPLQQRLAPLAVIQVGFPQKPANPSLVASQVKTSFGLMLKFGPGSLIGLQS